MSGGYFKQESPVYGSELKRYTGNFNLKHQLSNKFTTGLNLTLSSFNQVGEVESANFRNPIIAAMALLPTQEAYNADGSPSYDPNVFGQIYNPLAIIKYDKQNNQTSKLLGSVFLEYKVLENLKLTSRFGIDYNNIEEYLYYNPYFGDARTQGGTSANSYNRLYNWVWTNLADYNFHMMEDKIDGTFTVGYEAQQSKTYTQAGAGDVVPKNQNIRYPIPAVPTATSVTDLIILLLLLSRAPELYGKYSLQVVCVRMVHQDLALNRYGTFWSVGAAWNIDEEGLQTFSSLKLRSSYGVNGNAGIGIMSGAAAFFFYNL